VLAENRGGWRLAPSASIHDFIGFLVAQGTLKERKFRSEKYKRSMIRYTWGNPSPLALAISLSPRSYLCHGTAARLHGLVNFDPRTIYLNIEQSLKTSSSGKLAQASLDMAFSRQQRKSNLVYVNGDVTVTIIAGKKTDRLGVEELAVPPSGALAVTNLERTLIDLAVRPAYAGGIEQVVKAYRAAKDNVSVAQLLKLLEDLDYIYPYHQAIGFLMQQAGFPARSYNRLRDLGLSFNFYLTYGMKNPSYSEEWRLYYPGNLKSTKAARGKQQMKFAFPA
jgi:predicted transcriptional regulator of viral defense system